MEGADIYQIAKNCLTSVQMIEKFYAARLKHIRCCCYQCPQEEARSKDGADGHRGRLGLSHEADEGPPLLEAEGPPSLAEGPLSFSFLRTRNLCVAWRVANAATPLGLMIATLLPVSFLF